MGKATGHALWLQDPGDEWMANSVGEILRRGADEYGDRPAIHWPHPHGHLTTLDYATVYTEAARLARCLLSVVDPGTAVAVYTPNSVELVLFELASALAGTVLVPINPAMGDEEVEHIVNLTGARMILTVDEYRGSALLDRVATLAAARLPGLQVLNLPAWAEGADGTATLPSVRPQDRFIIQYTSGTTGKPKGALHTHEAALNAGAKWCQGWGHTVDDVLATAAPMYHVGGSIGVVLGTVATGASMGLMAAYDPALLIGLLKGSRATVLAAVPTILFDLLDQPGFSPSQLPHLRTVMGGGAFVPPDTIRSVEDRFNVQCIVTYGQSESPAILQTRRDDPITVKATMLGCPLPGRDVRIARADGSTASDGEVGEICTRTAMRMTEYVGQPAETASVIDSDGWLHTGDLGSMDASGYVQSRGRARDVIIRGGENIYPDEVENAIREHGAVSEVAIVGAAHERWGEVPVGFVVPAPGRQIDTEELTAFGRTKLAGFKIPRKWVVMSSLPLSPNGKVRKVELRQSLSDQSAAVASPQAAGG